MRGCEIRILIRAVRGATVRACRLFVEVFGLGKFLSKISARTTHRGTALDAGSVRKMFKRVCTAAGTADSWTPRELRTSFVSLMSHRGVSIEEIAHLVGHASTRTTEVVYRRELRPVITTGAEIMEDVFRRR